MQFGTRVRIIRNQRGMTQLELANRMSVSVSYISKVENERLQFGDYPSEKFIHRLAFELEADEEELMVLANKVPESIRMQIRERPGLFRAIARMNASDLDRLTAELTGTKKVARARKTK